MYYPFKGGYGAITDAYYDRVRPHVRLNTALVAIEPDSSGRYFCTFDGPSGSYTEQFDRIISSLPVSVMAHMLGLDVDLGFRGTNLLYLLVDKPQVTRHQYFYMADAKYTINRVTEFKNLASRHVPVDKTVLCCEVAPERFDTEAAIAELESAGLVKRSEVLDTKMIPLKRVYPVYDLTYEGKMRQIDVLFEQHPNLYMIGRNAQFMHQDIDDILEEVKRMVARFLNAPVPENVPVF